MTSVEAFANKVFSCNMAQQGKHLQNTSDRTVWYKVDRNSGTMLVPGLNVLRVNQPEVEKFLAAVESFLVHDLNDPIFNWDNLNLFDYSGEQCEEGLLMLRDSFAQGQLVAADIESRYLKWDGNKLLAIGFATDDDTCHAFWNIPRELYPLLQEVLRHPKPRYVWHNGKFDKNTLLYTCGIEARVDEDTMLKHFAQVSEKKGTHGLKYLGPLYLQAPQWDDQLDAIKKKFCRDNKIKLVDFTYDMIPPEILIPYMQRDCIATRRLLPVFDEIKEDGTDEVYRTLIRATEAFSWLEVNGATVNPQQLQKLDAEFTAQLEEANELVEDAVNKLWNPVAYANETGAKYSEDFSLASPKKLKWLLGKATGMTLESSDAATIEKLTEMVESGTLIVDDVAKELFKGIAVSRKAGKYRDTYVYGMQNAMRDDGKVSGSYLLHGTETGRLSSQNPNMQNIPRNKDVKNIFCATKGYKMVQLDYSQAELRVLGVLSMDDFLIQSYVEDKDLHANVAQKIFGPDFTKEQRTQCKTINFGIAYGRGAGAIAEAFKMTRNEAQALINDWFKAMPKVEQYIKRQRKAARDGERQQTMFGRVRHYTLTDENGFHVENEYINTPIQSMASDLTLNSLIEIHEWLVERGFYNKSCPAASVARIIATVHDSIVLEVKDDDELVREVAEHCQEVMRTVPERMIKNCPVPFKADVEVGYSWGALEEPNWNEEEE